MSRYRDLFKLPGATGFLLRTLLGRMPLGMLTLALLLYVRQETGSFGTAGLAVGATVLGEAASAPVQGTLVDRFGAARIVTVFTLVHCGLLSLLLVCGTAGAGGPVLITISGLAGTFVPPISASARTMWAEFSSDPDMREALFALDASSQEIIWTMGPLLVALGAVFGGPPAALALTTALTLLGGLAFATSAAARAARGARRARSGSALSSRGLRRLLPSVFVMGIGLGHLEVALPAVAVDVGASAAAGALLAAWSFGSLLGGAVYGIRPWGWTPRRRHVALLALLAVAVAPLAFASGIAVALPLSVVAGLFIAPAFSCQFVIVGAEAPEGTSTEAFSWYTTGLIGGISVGTAAAGQLVEAIGVHETLLSAVAALSLAAVAATRVPAARASLASDMAVEQEICPC